MISIVNRDQVSLEEILSYTSSGCDVEKPVAEIIDNVKDQGDVALINYEKQFDNVELKSLKVSEAEIEDAFKSVDDEFLRILNTSAQNIRNFHSNQLRKGFEIKDGQKILGQKITPIKKAGIYVPGGTAAYPSTVLMDSIPAQIAGCQDIIMVTPPSADGSVNSVILAAAKIAGVTEIFKVGGAQAIAALAYGTESIPKVDKIVGPGNVFVAEAKKQVFGQVSIDMIAGPSEILIIADSDANAKHLAADLLSQAEHDKCATAILITTSKDLANKVSDELEIQLSNLEREEIARASINNNGKIILVNSLDEAVELSNQIAPEHLELYLDDAFEYLGKVENAGSVFLGKNCPEALGDYYAGPNHTLPTRGTARFSNPLSVDDFIKKTQYSYYTKDDFKAAAKDIAYFANKEGLTAHAKSALSRLDDNE